MPLNFAWAGYRVAIALSHHNKLPAMPNKTHTQNHEEMADAIFSDREKQILEMIARGMTSREISDELGLSENTVETHRKRMISRIEAKNIFGVFHYTISRGILEPTVFGDPYLL